MTPIHSRMLEDVPFVHAQSFNSLLVRSTNRLDPQAAEHPYFKRLREGLRPQMEKMGDVAVVPVMGALVRRPELIDLAYGDAEDTDQVRAMVAQAAADPEIKGILLNIDSPGGFYTGGPELADAVRAADQAKPVVAHTSGMMASLAYWVGSQASAIVASRSAAVGSIGVYITVYDFSAYLERLGVKVEVFKNTEGSLKALGVMGTSLSDEQRDYLRGRAQAGFNEFRKTVRATRPDVKDEAMQGQTFNGSEAKSMGLIDRVGDLNFALSVLRREMRFRANA